ncbi:MAG: hypothetical protein QM710_12860 [Flavobacterium sp.]
MIETVTVDQAISKGKKTIIFPGLLLFFGSIIGSVVLVAQLDLTPWYIAGGFVFGLVAMYFYWNTQITKWRIWAFENVRNVHELKRKAIESKLIGEDNSRSERNEIRSREQKQKLKQLEKKFLEKDVYRDDFDVPKEMIIYFSQPKTLLMLMLGLIILGVVIYPFVTGGEKGYLLLIPFAFGSFMVFSAIKDLVAKEPQLILNASGVKFYRKDLMEWKDIANDIVEPRKEADYIRHYLVLDYKDRSVEMSVQGLGVKHNKIENLLRVYRVRYERNHPDFSAR